MTPEKLVVTDLDQGKARIEAYFSAEDVKNVFEVVRRILVYSNKIDSISEGDLHALLVEKLGCERLDSLYEQGVPDVLTPWAVDALDFEILGEPVLVGASDLAEGEPYAFALEAERKPLYELTSYEPVVLELPQAEIPEEEIDGYIAGIADDMSTYELITKRRPVKEGDRVFVSIQTSRNGEPVAALTSPRRSFDIGDGWFSRTFDENIIGMKVGEAKSFSFESLTSGSKDADDMETLNTMVSVLEIRERVAPEITDDWVRAEVQGADSVDELRDVLRKRFAEERREGEGKMRIMMAAQKLAERLDAAVPDAQLEQAVNEILLKLDQQAEQQEVSFEELIEQQGLSMDTLGETLLAQARGTILQGYALDAYFRHFDLEITEEDIDSAVAMLMDPSASQSAASMRTQYEQSGKMYVLREAARRYKANVHAAEHAMVKSI